MSKKNTWITISSFFLFIAFPFYAHAQVADLIIQKTGPVSVLEGGVITYTITISNNGPATVTDATFLDTIPAGIANVTFGSCTANGGAVCPGPGDYSITQVIVTPPALNYYIFKGTIPSLPVNSSITLVITGTAPSNTPISSLSNSATVSVPAGMTDPDLTTNTSTWNTVLIDPVAKNVDIAVIKTVSDVKGYDCTQLPKSYRYTVKWINKGPHDIPDVRLYDEMYSIHGTNTSFLYPWKISDTSWRSALGSSMPSMFPYIDTSRHRPGTPFNNPRLITDIHRDITLFKKGDTVTFSYTFTLYPPTNTECGGQISWDLRNRAYFFIFDNGFRDTVSINDTMTVQSGIMTCNMPIVNKKVDVEVLKTVDDLQGYAADNLPKSYNYTVQWVNHGPHDITDIYLMDIMQANGVTVRDIGTTRYDYPWNITNIVWNTSPGSQTSNPYGLTSGILRFDNNTLTPVTYTITEFGRVAPIFERGDTITLTFTFTLSKPTITGCGRINLTWDLYNRAQFAFNGCYEDTVLTNNADAKISGPMTATNISCVKTDLKVFKTVNDSLGYPCELLPKSYKYKITWTNGGPETVDSAVLSDVYDIINNVTGNGNAIYNYRWSLSNVQWSASSGVTVPSDTFNRRTGVFQIPCPIVACNFQIIKISSKIPKLRPGDSVFLSYTLNIERPTVTGCGRNISWDLYNTAGITPPSLPALLDTNINNNGATIKIANFTATATDLVVSTAVNPTIVNSGDLMTVTNEFYNASGSPAIPASWSDTLPETFQINTASIQCTTISGAAPCGTITYDPVTRVLKQTIANMPANSGVRVTFTGTVVSLYTITEYNKAFAYYSCLDCISSTNFTQTNYQVNGNCDSVFAGLNGDTSIYANSRDTIDLFSVLNSRYVPGGTLVRISGTGGTFNAVNGTLIVNASLTTSVFRYNLPGNGPCPPDTSFITINILPPPLPDTITEIIKVNSTDTACGFLPAVMDNITVTSCSGASSGNTIHGSWTIDPITKCLSYNAGTIKGSDTLCITVCNTLRGVCTNTVVIIIVEGVPPIATNDDAETQNNTPVVITVLTNDYSPDNDSIQMVSTTQPAHGTVTINSNGTITYTPAAGYEGLDSFQYVICEIDGCDTAWVIVNTGCGPEGLCCDLPNAFSPNTDGINDIFRARCTCDVEQFYLVIYDRWGEKVFESSDVNTGWDGFYKSVKARADAFAYYLEYTPVCNKQQVTKKGNVTVLK